MRTVARGDLSMLLGEARRNLRFCCRAAASLFVLDLVLVFASLRMMMLGGGQAAGAGPATVYVVLLAISRLAAVACGACAAAIYPLLRQCGRLGRLLEVARRSAKESVELHPFDHSLARMLRVIVIGMFAVWAMGAILVDLPMEAYFGWQYVLSGTFASHPFPFVPRLDSHEATARNPQPR